MISLVFNCSCKTTFTVLSFKSQGVVGYLGKTYDGKVILGHLFILLTGKLTGKSFQLLTDIRKTTQCHNFKKYLSKEVKVKKKIRIRTNCLFLYLETHTL